MKVQAYDLGKPQMFSSEIDVFVTVVRNQNPPIFTQELYFAQLQENSFLGQSVYKVSANDADTEVCELLYDFSTFSTLKAENTKLDFSFCIKTIKVFKIKFVLLYIK